MPFTFSHPIFAAPLKQARRSSFSLTGLVLGSMAPDFEYFIHLEPYRSIGHTTAGLFLHAIPLSLLFALLFHTVMKLPLAVHLPSWLDLDLKAASLVKPWRLNRLRAWLVFLSSVTIGFYTHIVIDEFTHQSGYFVLAWPVLQEAVMGMALYKWLQYSFSIFGLLLEFGPIIYFIRQAPSAPSTGRRTSRQKLYFWLTTFDCMVITVALKLIFSSGDNVVGMVVVSSISGFCIGLFVACLVANYRIKQS